MSQSFRALVEDKVAIGATAASFRHRHLLSLKLPPVPATLSRRLVVDPTAQASPFPTHYAVLRNEEETRRVSDASSPSSSRPARHKRSVAVTSCIVFAPSTCGAMRTTLLPRQYVETSGATTSVVHQSFPASTRFCLHQFCCVVLCSVLLGLVALRSDQGAGLRLVPRDFLPVTLILH